MRALDLGDVEEAGGVTTQQSAGEAQPWNGLNAAGADRARAIADAAPALDVTANRGMQFEALQLIERAEVRVAVVETHHEPDGNAILSPVINEASSIGLR